jgi:hypothetical protein
MAQRPIRPPFPLNIPAAAVPADVPVQQIVEPPAAVAVPGQAQPPQAPGLEVTCLVLLLRLILLFFLH